MSKMIQLRNVPESLHRRLKGRAALAGMSLSDYLIAEIRRSAERPTLEELRERLASRRPVHLKTSPADVIRAERERIGPGPIPVPRARRTGAARGGNRAER